MVKRQTVWLSTMMVLSLMLIGYYTMNNGSTPTTAGSGDAGSVVGSSAVNPPTGAGSGAAASGSSASSGTSAASGASASGSQTSSASQSSGQQTSSDWFVNYQTQLDQQVAQQQDALNQIMTSNNATSNQISKADQDLQVLSTLKGELDNARDAVLGEGYSACVVVPTMTTSPPAITKVTVYVKASTLSASQAVAVMNIVSQQLNIPIMNIVVAKHA